MVRIHAGQLLWLTAARLHCAPAISLSPPWRSSQASLGNALVREALLPCLPLWTITSFIRAKQSFAKTLALSSRAWDERGMCESYPDPTGEGGTREKPSAYQADGAFGAAPPFFRAAHRAFIAAASLARPSALIPPRAFGLALVVVFAGADFALTFAQRACCATRIFSRASGDIVRLPLVWVAVLVWLWPEFPNRCRQEDRSTSFGGIRSARATAKLVEVVRWRILGR